MFVTRSHAGPRLMPAAEACSMKTGRLAFLQLGVARRPCNWADSSDPGAAMPTNRSSLRNRTRPRVTAPGSSPDRNFAGGSNSVNAVVCSRSACTDAVGGWKSVASSSWDCRKLGPGLPPPKAVCKWMNGSLFRRCSVAVARRSSLVACTAATSFSRKCSCQEDISSSRSRMRVRLGAIGCSLVHTKACGNRSLNHEHQQHHANNHL